MSDTADPAASAEIDGQTRRDFLFTTTAAVGAVGECLGVAVPAALLGVRVDRAILGRALRREVPAAAAYLALPRSR